ncbi:SBBP repeat-containing protein [Hymenobacter persicinus]|uniref:Pyrrolo-quinoline quinone repeat domain-containing protein n=1 Tax=Hymenobacter persicinus TaxID=2025506 RepID=A0A4Q5LDB8_9BACT|nr:SBBP repeat-containing protein [Hymenobacter persicinus]RYU79559.1 hypothetical protein EWM57_10355 [Hymenobacter persicinus]
MYRTLYARFRYSSFFTRFLILCCCTLCSSSALFAQQATEAWAARYGAADRDEEPYSITVDQAGNSYVAGIYANTSDGSQWVMVKYSPAGERLWASVNSNGSPKSIAVDNVGGVYMIGNMDGVAPSGGADFMTVRYDAATGAQTWVSRYNGPANGIDWVSALAVDNAGGVFVTGRSEGINSKSDYATIRYDAVTGAQSWVSRYNGPAYEADNATDIAVDNAGGVYVTGTSYSYSYSGALVPTYLTMRYVAATGARTWLNQYGTSLSNSAGSIAVDNSGRVYVGGSTQAFKDIYGTVLCISASTGNQIWSSQSSGSVNSLEVDNAGGVYVLDYVINRSTNTSYSTLARYDAAGGVRSWYKLYDGTPRDLGADKTGVYTTGSGGTTRYNAADGAVVWNKPQNGNALDLDQSSNVLVTGLAFDPSTGNDLLTVKYSQVPSADNSFTFYRAVNLNGPALTLDGNAWAGSTAPNYSTNGTGFTNSTTPLVPATDAARTDMIRSSVYRVNSLKVSLSAVPAGIYQVYLYVWEDNGAEAYSLTLNGQVVRSTYNSGLAGTWARLGPYDVTLTAKGSVQLVSRGGTANFSGIELWKQQPAAARTETAALPAALPLVSAQCQAYPNPSADGRYHLVLPEALRGEVEYVLLSAVGQPLRKGTLHVSGTGAAELDVSAQLNQPGIQYLQLTGTNARAHLKLLHR